MEKNRDDMRQRLIDVARELFSERGYDKTSVREIYAAANLSNGTFYHYFKSKEFLLAALIDTNAEVYDLLTDIDEKAKNPARHLYEYYVSYANYWTELGVPLAAQVYRLYGNVFLNEDYSKKAMYSLHCLSEYIAAAQRLGTAKKVLSPDDTAEYFFMMTRGVLYEWILRNGSFDLIQVSKKYAPILISSFLPDDALNLAAEQK